MWYFTPYYAMLRAVPAFLGTQFWGVLVMGGAVLIFFLLPWLDRSPVKSIRYKGPYLQDRADLVCDQLPDPGMARHAADGFPGQASGKTEMAVILARLFTAVYFAFFLLMPWYSRIDKTKPEPERVTG